MVLRVQYVPPTILNTKQGWARCPPLPVQWEKKENDIVRNALGKKEESLCSKMGDIIT